MKIGIIGALEQELKNYLDKFTVNHVCSETPYTFYECSYEGVEIYLVICGVGKVNAAVATCILCRKYNIEFILNTGVAAGLSNELKIGDIVIGREFKYYDVDVTPFGFSHGQQYNMPEKYYSDELLLQQALLVQLPLAECTIFEGMILSGDSFVYKESQAEEILNHTPAALAVEMESCSIAQTCYILNMPLLVIRAISDIVGRENKNDFIKFLDQASERSFHFIEKFIKLVSLSYKDTLNEI